MNVTEVVRLITIKARTDGVDAASKSLRDLAQAQETNSKGQLSAERGYERVQNRLDQVHRAQRAFERDVTDLTRAQMQGLVPQERLNEILSMATQRYQGVAQAAGGVANQLGTANAGMIAGHGAASKYATGAGLARYELINLSRQIQDVGVSLASGQSAFMVLTQQGTQIADIFASSQVSVGEFFNQAVAGAGRFLGSTKVLIGAYLGFGAAAAAVTVMFQSSQRDIERGLMGIAGASRATVSDINQIANSSRSVFGFSAGEARASAMTFAATGRIMVENIRPLVELSDQLSRALGIGAADASKKLATAFADPARGAVELNKEFGALDQRTLDYIRTLQAMGNAGRAQQVMMEELGPAIRRMADQISFTDKAWRLFVNVMKEGFVEIPAQALSQAFNINPGTIKQLNDAQQHLKNLQEIFLAFPNNPAIIEQIGKAAERVRELQQTFDATDPRGYSASLNAIAESARGVAAAFVPEIAALEKAGLAFNNLLLVSQSPDFSVILEKSGLTAQQFATALERAGMAYTTMLSPAERLTAQHELQIQSITARTHEERIALAVKERAVQLAGASLGPEERALELARARTRAVAEIAARHQDAMVALQGELAIAQAVTGQERLRAQEAAAYNQLIQQNFEPEQASAQAAGQRAVAQAQINSQAQGTLAGLEDQHRVISATTETEKLRAQEAARYNELTRQGVESGLAASIAAQERLNAEAAITVQLDRQAAAQRRAAEEANKMALALEEQRQILRDRAFLGTSDDWLSGKPSGKGGQFDVGPTQQAQAEQFFQRIFGKGGADVQVGPQGFGRRGTTPGLLQSVTVNEQGLRNIADSILGSGGSLQQAIAEVNKQASSRGVQTVAPGAAFGVLQDLYDLLSQEQGGSTAAQVQSLEQQIAFLRSQPRSIERDRAMYDLIDELKNLRESTDALNSTIGLDPLYTQGHGYIGIGYNPHGGSSPRIPIDPNTQPYVPSLPSSTPTGTGGPMPGPIRLPISGGMTSGGTMIDPRTGRPIMGLADGGSFMVHGSGMTDSKYVPLALTPGELIEVTPPRDVHTGTFDRNAKPTVVNNNVTNTFNFPPSREYGDRRSQRHLTEGFGRAMAQAR